MQSLVHLIPYWMSFAASGLIGVYAWRQQNVNGTKPFAVAAWGQALWTFGYIFELMSNTLSAKIFWDDFQLFGGILWVNGFIAFACAYSGSKLPFRRWNWALLMLINVWIITIAFTDPLTGWLRLNPELIPREPFSVLVYDFTVAIYFMYAFILLYFGLGFFYLLRVFVRPHGMFRAQVATIIAGTLVPVIALGFSAADITLAFQRDISPITFGISNLIISFGLFRFRLFDIMPVAQEQVLQHMSDGVIVLDRHNRLIELNPAAREMLAGQASLQVGEHIRDMFDGLPQRESWFQSNDPIHTEIVTGIGDKLRHCDLRILTVQSSKGKQVSGRIIVLRDITERKLAEAQVRRNLQELHRANEQLTLLSRAKDDFVSNVSHELRTPITSIQLNLDLMRMQPQRAETLIDRLERETQRLTAIIDDLLQLSRLDQNRASITLQRVNLNEIGERFVQDRTSFAEHYNITLRYHTHEALPNANADPALLEQALSILVTNAVHYTPAGGRVTVFSDVLHQSDGVHVCITVQDTGPGIHPDEVEKLFERFYRGKAGVDSGVSGTGLGLAIAQEIMNKHGGRITATSEGVPGKGATFTLMLPAVISTQLNIPTTNISDN